ncbi:MAG: hypothetical protein ACYSUC_10050 [Planctomycetota bacterium]|jgi:hypothetical protein
MLVENSRPYKLEAISLRVVGGAHEVLGEGYSCGPKTTGVLAYGQSNEQVVQFLKEEYYV